MFCCVSYHLGPFGFLAKLVQNSPNLFKSSCHEVASEFFAMNAPDRLHWTLNSCFVAFRTIWDRLVSLQNWCKMGRTSSKVRTTKSRQNFSQRTHPMVQNTPKHEFRVQWGGSGAFVAKCSCHEVASEFFATNAPDPPHWTLNSYFGAFRTVCVHLGPLSCLTKLGAKHSELVQKFVPRSRVRIFRNEHTRSTPLNPKLKFCCISYHLGAFGTIWLLTKLGAN